MARSLLDKLLKRGLISGIYPESIEYRSKLSSILSEGPATIYTGFDATASSLHIGNLATITNLLHFQRDGHQVICVIGDATTQIGDPSGHTKDRKRIDKLDIQENVINIERTIHRLFDNYKLNFLSQTDKEVKKPIVIRNSVWYKDSNVIDFVGDIFREVRVGALLHKKSIQERLKTQAGMNMSEFSYQIFQAFDWMELRKRYNCKLQLGGSDQGGNIYTGHDLIRRCLDFKDSIGLLAPLITDRYGKKLGKSTTSTASAIWLNADQTSPFDLYQYFLRTPDDDVEKFLNVFSFYDDDYIEEIIKNNLKNRDDIWFCQRKLAEHVCLLVHGHDGLSTAKQITNSMFPKKTNKK